MYRPLPSVLHPRPATSHRATSPLITPGVQAGTITARACRNQVHARTCAHVAHFTRSPAAAPPPVPPPQPPVACTRGAGPASLLAGRQCRSTAPRRTPNDTASTCTLEPPPTHPPTHSGSVVCTGSVAAGSHMVVCVHAPLPAHDQGGLRAARRPARPRPARFGAPPCARQTCRRYCALTPIPPLHPCPGAAWAGRVRRRRNGAVLRGAGRGGGARGAPRAHCTWRPRRAGAEKEGGGAAVPAAGAGGESVGRAQLATAGRWHRARRWLHRVWERLHRA